MHCLLVVFLFHLLLISRSRIVGDTILLESIKNDHIKFGISCSNDYCQFSQADSLELQTCHCGVHCVQLGTCCFDSPYANVAQPSRKPTCRYIHDGFYYIMNKCSSAGSVWASQCNDESSGDDDLQKLVPVTSLKTNITYKNYYCFRCYETGEQFKYWNLKIHRDSIPIRFSEPESKDLSKHISYIYNKNENTVMASYCGGIGYFPVRTKLEIPPEIKNLTHVCEPGVISDCSEDWHDEEIRKKCHAYMAIKEVEQINNPPIKYKNIHCALCNFENLNSLSCRKSFSGRFGTGGYGGAGTGGGGTGGYVPGAAAYAGGAGTFSLESVFNINPSKDVNDEQSEIDDKQCPDGKQWNPYANDCRKLTCLMSGYIPKGDTCVKA